MTATAVSTLQGFQLVVREPEEPKGITIEATAARMRKMTEAVRGRVGEGCVEFVGPKPGPQPHEFVFDIITKSDVLLGYSPKTQLNLWLLTTEPMEVPLIWWTQAKVVIDYDWGDGDVDAHLEPLFEPLRG